MEGREGVVYVHGGMRGMSGGGVPKIKKIAELRPEKVIKENGKIL